MRNHFNILKRSYETWKSASNISGAGVDASLDKDAWREYCAAHPGAQAALKRFRGGRSKDLEDLLEAAIGDRIIDGSSIVFPAQVAEGFRSLPHTRSSTSTTLSPTLGSEGSRSSPSTSPFDDNEMRPSDDEGARTRAPDLMLCTGSSLASAAGVQRQQAGRKRKTDAMHECSSALAAIIRQWRDDERESQRSGRWVEDAVEIMDELESEEINEDMKDKAMEMLANENTARLFLAMSHTRRVRWIIRNGT